MTPYPLKCRFVVSGEILWGVVLHWKLDSFCMQPYYFHNAKEVILKICSVVSCDGFSELVVQCPVVGSQNFTSSSREYFHLFL